MSALFDFLHELGKEVAGDLRTDEISRTLYSTDASIYQVKPHGVLIPQTAVDVQTAVALAAKYQIPLLPRTAGSSLAGQAVNEALVIDFTRHLDQVLELNTEEGWVRVQPGIVLDELNAYLQPHGWQFGPDPASSNRAAMGGIVSNNSTGSHSILYGMTTDHVLEMNVILNDGSSAYFAPIHPDQLDFYQRKSGREGEIYRQISQLVSNSANQQIISEATPRMWRRCGGYNLDRLILNTKTQTDTDAKNKLNFVWPIDERLNLAKLVSGAEGTLAAITEIKLNLVPVPKQTALAIVHFESLHAALTAVPILLSAKPSAIELLDNLGLTLCREVPEYARLLSTFIEGQPNCVLITEFYGESEKELRAKVKEYKAFLQREKVGATAVTTAFSRSAQTDVWTVRKVGLGLLMSIKGDHKPIPFIEDSAVPVEHLAEYIDKVERFCNDLGTDVAYYAHASAGCLHVRPLINAKQAKEVAKLPEITSFVVDLLKGYGGSFSSEHGDGRARSWLNEPFFGPDLYGLYQQTKQIFDPDNIFNPGNIVNAGPMTDNLRYGASYQTIPLTSHIDFSEHFTPQEKIKEQRLADAQSSPATGFYRAVEMCNGAGICRKKTTGTMCPSFMVTREEVHSTRGRANALRAALSGKLPATDFTGDRLYEVMDLCIECKACKAECPSSVDMAKIKFEFLAQYYDKHGVPLRTRLFAHFGQLAPLGSGKIAPTANATMNNPLVRGAMEKFLGISRHRQLPPFVPQPFTDWFATQSPISHPRSQIVLFVDPFTNYNYPHVAKAAIDLFHAAGLGVTAVAGEDGRPFISKGLVNEAKQAAQQTAQRLQPYAEQGIPIIGLEPSSILTLRDEYLYLLADRAVAEQLATHAYTFEEFIAKLADEDTLNLTFTTERREVLLHGHCHQKALVGTKPSHRTLSLPPNYTVTEVDSGCCGMAGSFGYEAEHYGISLQMAERRLLPAVRKVSHGTIIAAAGLSCRQQIKHGSGRRALHPAEILRDALAT